MSAFAAPPLRRDNPRCGSASSECVARPFVVMGVNALALFVVSGWLVKTLLWWRVSDASGQPVTLYRWIYTTVFQPLAPPKIASLLFAVAALLVLYALLEVMYRRRWFVRA